MIDISLKGMFTSHRLTHIISNHWTIVYFPREIIKHSTRLAKLLHQMLTTARPEILSHRNTHEVHFMGSLLAYTPELFYLQTIYKLLSFLRMNHTETVGLTIIRSHLSQELTIRYTSRGSQMQFFTDSFFYFFGNIHSQLNILLIMRDIQESLIKR